MARNVAQMSGPQSDTWLQLIALSELLPAALDAQLRRDSNITHFEFAVLSLVQLAPLGALSPSDIAQTLNATLPRLSHVLARLEANGLLTRTAAMHDRRGVEVRLTTRGRRVAVKATPAHIATAKSLVLDQFSDDELETLAGLLRRITDRLDPRDRLGHAIRSE
ncbi:MAG: MarR family winged helix-turn-helix transcriptional regulator [Pseudolysinimonas sp.]